MTLAPKPDFPVQEFYAEVDHARIRYLRAGRGSSLILLHGLLGYSFSWRFALPGLAQNSTVYAPDMLGFGFSDRPATAAHDLNAAAERILKWMDTVGIASADLLGTSYGGAVALMAACLAPDRFGRLILVDSVNSWSRYAERRIDWLRRPWAQILAAYPWLLRPWHNFLLRRLYGDPHRIHPGTLEGYEAPLKMPGMIRTTLQILRTWKQDLQILERMLPNIAEIPALLIWGDRDRAVDPDSAIPLARVFHHSRLVMLRGVGHLPYEESPQEFVQPIVEFLSAEHSQ